MTTNAFAEMFKRHRVIGVAGNRSTGKSSLVLTQLVDIAKTRELPIFVFGVEPSLEPYLESQGVNFLYNREDIFDLKIKDSVIYVDEIADMISPHSRSKKTDSFKRFINRIEHNNCWFVLSTAESCFFNKLACSLINAFIVKEVDFDSLVNGTWLKRIVQGFPRTSDYRVDLPKNMFYSVINDGLCKKHSFKYNHNLDSKIDNVNPFVAKKIVKKSERICGKKSEKIVTKKMTRKLTKKVIVSDDKKEIKKETKGDDLK